MKLDDLKAYATAKPVQGGETTIVVSLGGSEEAGRAIHALGRFFVEDDKRTAVQLKVDGNMVGYLNRRDFFSDDEAVSKLGGAQAAELPGLPEFTFIKLACPVDGCDTLILKIHYDERNPEHCPIHRDKTLQVVTRLLAASSKRPLPASALDLASSAFCPLPSS